MPSDTHQPIDFVAAIHKSYEGLSSREKEVADFILNAPGDLSMYPGSELAERVGVSNSTITRFVKRVGFDSYEDMRRAAREARQAGSPLFVAARETSDSSPNKLLHFADIETACVHAALADLGLEKLDEIAEALASAREVGFMGFRNSHFLASYARRLVFQFRAGTRLIPSSPGESIAERIADLGPEDVVVVVALRRILAPMRSYVEAVRQTGAKILLISDPSVRILPSIVDWSVICPVETPHVFDSYSGPMAVLRLLAFEAFKKSGTQGRAYLSRIEAGHELLHELGLASSISKN